MICEHKRLFDKWSKYLDEVRRLGGFTADLCCECTRVVRVRLVGRQLIMYGAFDWPKAKRHRRFLYGRLPKAVSSSRLGKAYDK